MYTDKSLLLAAKVNIFGAAGSAWVGDVIDWRDRQDLRGAGKPMGLAITVNTAVNAGTSVQFRLYTATALSGGNLNTSTSSVVVDTGAVARTSLTVGAKYLTYLPFASWLRYYRYMQLRVTRVGPTSAAGSITAALVLDPPHWEALKAESVQLI